MLSIYSLMRLRCILGGFLVHLQKVSKNTYFAVIRADPTKPVGRATPIVSFVFALNIKGTRVLLAFDKGTAEEGQNDYRKMSALHSAPHIEIRLVHCFSPLSNCDIRTQIKWRLKKRHCQSHSA